MNTHPHLTHQRGLSIVELMVGMAIGLVILVVLSALVVNNTQARTELDQSMQQVENGRYGIQLLLNEVRLAGYYGSGDKVGSAPVAMPDPCADSARLVELKDALPVAVQGYSKPGASPLVCLGATDFLPGTDVLVVRRALTETVDPATLNPTLPYLQSMGTEFKFDIGTNVGAFSLKDRNGDPAPVHPYAVHIYFVSPCDVPAGNAASCTGGNDDRGRPIPTLKRMELTAAGWTTVSLVQGIEMMHIEYGVDTDNDGTPDKFVDEAATAAEWANVVTVKLYLLARNTEVSRTGYRDEKTYNLGNLVIPKKDDSYKRHAYGETIRLVNVSSRRDQ